MNNGLINPNNKNNDFIDHDKYGEVLKLLNHLVETLTKEYWYFMFEKIRTIFIVWASLLIPVVLVLCCCRFPIVWMSCSAVLFLIPFCLMIWVLIWFRKWRKKEIDETAKQLSSKLNEYKHAIGLSHYRFVSYIAVMYLIAFSRRWRRKFKKQGMSVKQARYFISHTWYLDNTKI